MAVGKFLVDFDPKYFPCRKTLVHFPEQHFIHVRLDTPCGIIRVTVPVLADGTSDPVLNIRVFTRDCKALSLDVEVYIPLEFQWPKLKGRTSVTVDFSYGGACFCIIKDRQLGFSHYLELADPAALNKATRNLRKSIGGGIMLFKSSIPTHR